MDDLSAVPADEPLEFTPDRDMIRNAISSYKFAVNGAVNAGIEGDPEKAAHAVRLGTATGIPAPLINDNYDEFITDQKKATAQAIVNSNPQLQEYVAKYPLTGTVSADDWAELDEYTRKNNGSFFKNLADAIHRPLAAADVIADETLDAITSGWSASGLPTGMEESAAKAIDASQNRAGLLGALAARLVYGTIDTALKIGGAVMQAPIGAAKGGFMMLGEEPTAAQRYAEGLVMGLGSEFAPHEPLQTVGPGARAEAPMQGPARPRADVLSPENHALFMLRPFLEAGEDAPQGLHPLIDAQKAQMNQSMLDLLEEDLKAATATQTRERSPEMFRDGIIAGRYGDHSIGIHADAALALYGDKVPEVDDGLLGWVPDIGVQLAAARDTGQDIVIPTADWLAKVDPAVAKTLREDMRMWPGGVTAREATLIPPEPKQVVQEPVAIWRMSMGAEPKFSMGDRKLTLQKAADTPEEYSIGGEVEHNWEFLDENGKSVGNVFLTPTEDGKGLYVNWISGAAGMWANSFGPALIRDIKRQLKEAYPDREYIAGFRVSGARDKAGKTGPAVARLDQELPDRVPLVEDVPSEANHYATQEILHQAYQNSLGTDKPGGFEDIRGVSGGLDGGPASATPLPEWYHDIHSTLQELAQQLGVPEPKYYAGTHDGSVGGVASSLGHIIVNDRLSRPEALATSLHEFGHHVDFTALEQADPATRSAIARAYQRDTGAGKTVEQTRPITAQRYEPQNRAAPAGAYHTSFPEWFAEQVSRWITQVAEPKTVLDKFFKGLADAWRKIYEKVTGHVALASEVDQFMRGLWRGEEGQSEHPISQAIRLMDPVIEGIENVQAASVGLDTRTYAKMQEAIRARAREDLRKAEARAVKEQTKRQSAEWAKNRVEVLAQTAEDIRRKPDVAADLFLGSGEYNGEKMRQRFTLAEGKLTEEQRAALPEHYVSKNGLDPDQVAPLFGYSTGEEMVAAVSALQKLKVNEAGKPMRTSDWLRKVIQAETDRRMVQRYGDKAANIMDAAQDQALSDSSINMMHEELLAVAQKMGVTTFSKEVLWKAAEDIANSTTIGRLNSFRAMQDMGRHSRNAEAAMVAGNWAEAAVHMQRQTLTAMVARELKAAEKEVAKAEKFAKRWAKRDQPSVPPEYANWIHDIMQRTGWGGRKVLRTPEDIARQIAGEGAQTLEEFVRSKSLDLDPLHVWEGLFDPQFQREWKGLTVDEFRKIDESLQNLVGIGKGERELILGDERMMVEDAVAQLLERTADLEPKNLESQLGKFFPTKFVKGAFLRTLQVENILNALDGFSAFGPWTRFLFRELKEGDNHAEAWRKEYSRRLAKLDDGTDLRKAVPNQLFRAPEEWGGELLPMNRGNLRTVLLNWGSESNRKKLAKGWGVAPEQVEAWLAKHATKEDYEFAQGVWDIFAELKEKSDTMERSLGRMATKTVEAVPLQTQFGEYKGGYYPIVLHRQYGRVRALEDVDRLMQPGYESLEPADGFTKSRTKAVQPVALDMDMMPARLNQVIHRTAMLPSVKNFTKLLYEPRVRSEITRKLGVEMYSMLDEYIKGVANKANYGVAPWQDALTVSDFLRANVTTGLVGLNIFGTAVKHGSTAWVLSLKEAGARYLKDVGVVPGNYISRAVRQLFSTNEFTAETRYKFAMDHSLELQRRDRNYLESLTGATAELNVPKSATFLGRDLGAGVQRFLNFRQRMMELASAPLAFSDKLSSVPTWLAVYDHSMETGMTHGDAVYAADRAVRRAHGSTAITSRPIIMNDLGGWLTTFYNFFNDVFNRQVETLWRAGDALKLTREGQYGAAMKQAGLVAAGVFAYSIWPAIVEHLVSPQPEGHDEGIGKKIAKAMMYTEGATMPVVRDLVNGLLQGKVPDVGMISTIYQHATDLPRDLHKQDPFSPEHAQIMIKHAGEFAAVLTGMPEALTKAGAYAYGVHAGTEHPRGPWGWMVGARYGSTKHHSQTAYDRFFGP